MTRLILASFAAAGLGVVIQTLTRASVGDLETQATLAWNAGDTDAAEILARRALVRDPQSQRAQEVLQQLTLHSPQPALVVALEVLRTDEQSPVDQALRNGETALGQDLLRVAEAFWEEGLERDPNQAVLRARLVTLAGIRLDPQTMLTQLLEMPDKEDLHSNLVLLCLSGFAVDTHGAFPTEVQLRWSLEADSRDVKTRLALARALMLLGRHQECRQILEVIPDNESAATLMAVLCSINGQPEAAEFLPAQPPRGYEADYFRAAALIRARNGDEDGAISAWRNAVLAKPLSSSLRAQFCDALRNSGNTTELRREAAALDQVREIAEVASSEDTVLTPGTLNRLQALCEAVGADDATRLLARVQPDLEHSE